MANSFKVLGAVYKNSDSIWVFEDPNAFAFLGIYLGRISGAGITLQRLPNFPLNGFYKLNMDAIPGRVFNGSRIKKGEVLEVSYNVL